MLNRLIQVQVDFILFEEGSFSPLNWLLREGHLDYNDYLSWKNGRSIYLEDYFKTPITTLLTALQAAKDYANLIKLEVSRQTHFSIDNQPLHFCRSATEELIFTRVYEPAQDRMQMDLFLDSADTCTVSNLINAIVEGRGGDIADLMAKLAPLSPDKHQKFKQLLNLEQKISQNKLNSEQKIDFVVQKLTPLALEILGRFTLDFLTPVWHKLSEQVTDLPFDVNFPDNHLSFTAYKEFQWQQVLASIDREKDWYQQPLLIFRYAEASFKLNKEREGIELWCKLFISFPEYAERLIKDSCNRLMFDDWQCFSELDPELETFLFPAWMVMKRPGLINIKFTSEMPEDETLQLIEKLVCQTENIINATLIQHRSRLKQINPALFVHYMRAHSRGQ